MNEQSLLDVSDDVSLGKVEIAPEVIEVITGLATLEVKGLASMRGNFATGVAEKLGKKSHGKGVKVELTDSGILIDLFVAPTLTIVPNLILNRLGSKLEFAVAQNVIDMLYRQALIWVGSLVCPMVPLLGTINNLILYFVKYFVVRKSFQIQYNTNR